MVARIVLLSIVIAAMNVSAAADTTVTDFRGTREVRYTVYPGDPHTQDYDETNVATSRVLDVTSAVATVETEHRRFVPTTGLGRFDAVATLDIIRHESVSKSGDVSLVELETDAKSFLAVSSPSSGSGYSPFDSTGERRTTEVRNRPELIWTARRGTYRRNDIARWIETSIDHGAGAVGTISERIGSDGSVHQSGYDSQVSIGLKQDGRGAGETSGAAVGFYTFSNEISAPERGGDGYDIPISTASTGREVGGPQPVVTTHSAGADWYPGGRILPPESDILTTSSAADLRMPRRCGATFGGRPAYGVRERKARTRIDGTNETDTLDSYTIGSRIVCTVEWDRVERFDIHTGRLLSRVETITALARHLGAMRL